MILIEPYVEFLTKHKINPEQYLLLSFLYFNRIDLIRDYKTAFPKDTKSVLVPDDMKDLIKKGFIIPHEKGYKLSETFINIFVTPEVVVDEIYNIYPPFLIKDTGMHIPLLGMDREVFKTIYLRTIKNSLKEHQEVIADILYGKQNNLILIGIDKFLTSQQWKIIRVKRKSNPITAKAIDNEDF